MTNTYDLYIPVKPGDPIPPNAIRFVTPLSQTSNNSTIPVPQPNNTKEGV